MGASSGAAESTGGPDVLRPGRFLETLHTIRAELEKGVEEQTATAETLRRVGDILMESCAVLDRMQRAEGKAAATSPGASVGPQSPSSDGKSSR
jgi:hypothetical protein